jgi:hypothetical protein
MVKMGDKMAIKYPDVHMYLSKYPVESFLLVEI